MIAVQDLGYLAKMIIPNQEQVNGGVRIAQRAVQGTLKYTLIVATDVLNKFQSSYANLC